MNRFARRLGRGIPASLAGFLLASPAVAAAQGAEPTRVAVIDIDRIAQESAKGQAMFTELQGMQEEILRGRQAREQEIRDLTNRAGSQLLSQEARADLTRDIERKQTDLQRWLEDQQREFNDKQTTGFQSLEQELGPVVEEVRPRTQHPAHPPRYARTHFIMDPVLDISGEVITRFNALNEGQSEP